MIDFAHYLTGRDKDFHAEVFNTGDRPALLKADELVEAARAVLFPGREDYFVFGAIGALAASPAIAASLRLDLPSPTVLVDLQHPNPKWFGAEVDLESSKIPTIRHRATEWPPPFAYELSYEDPDFGNLTANSRSRVIRVNHQNEVIYPEWPVDTGIEGGLVPSIAWSDDTVILVRFLPCCYPWRLVSDRMRDDAKITELLHCTGYASIFGAATSPVEKIGAVVAAILSYQLN